MTKRMILAAVLAVSALGLSATPAGARWWGDGRWHHDDRWHSGERYHGYYYRAPPVIFGTPYNYGYYSPPVVYDSAPGFSITIRP